MNTYYLFSGLGADHRAFGALEFPGEVKHVVWIPPLSGEPMAEYAKRMAAQITASCPILVGLSFGGMMALEVSRHLPTAGLVLISSAKSKAEIPHSYLWMGALGVHRLIPDAQVKKANRLLYWLFGAETPSERKLLAAILADTDPMFFRWAINSISAWQNSYIPPNAIHIHCTADRILPLQFVKADYVIQGETHFMAINRAKEISEIIRNISWKTGKIEEP